MALIKCKKCGKVYSDFYGNCPYCIDLSILTQYIDSIINEYSIENQTEITKRLSRFKDNINNDAKMGINEDLVKRFEDTIKDIPVNIISNENYFICETEPMIYKYQHYSREDVIKFAESNTLVKFSFNRRIDKNTIIYIPNGVVSIAGFCYEFYSVHREHDVTGEEGFVFENIDCKAIVFPDTLKNIYGHSFNEVKSNEIVLPQKIKMCHLKGLFAHTIDFSKVENKYSTAIYCEQSVNIKGTNQQEELTLPNNLTILNNEFFLCGVKTLIINGDTEICTNLSNVEKLIINGNVKIHKSGSSFPKFPKLKTVIYNTDNKNGYFLGYAKNIFIKTVNRKLNIKNNEYQNVFLSDIRDLESCYGKYNCPSNCRGTCYYVDGEKIEEIHIGKINDRDCFRIEKIIERKIFDYCPNIKKLVIYDQIENMPTFKYCESLSTIDFQCSKITLPDDAFCSCSNISYITLPKHLVLEGPFGFSQCEVAHIESLSFPQGFLLINKRNMDFSILDQFKNIYTIEIYPNAETKFIVTGSVKTIFANGEKRDYYNIKKDFLIINKTKHEIKIIYSDKKVETIKG